MKIFGKNEICYEEMVRKTYGDGRENDCVQRGMRSRPEEPVTNLLSEQISKRRLIDSKEEVTVFFN